MLVMFEFDIDVDVESDFESDFECECPMLFSKRIYIDNHQNYFMAIHIFENINYLSCYVVLSIRSNYRM